MPRPRLAAVTAVVLAAAAVAALRLAAGPADPAGPAAVQAAPSAQAARSPLTATLDDGTVAWRVAPYGQAAAWWLSGESRVYSAFATADAAGHVVLSWTDPTPERTDDDQPFGALDGLVVATGAGYTEAYTVPLPALDAALDAPGDRIVLRGPPGATLAVRLRSSGDRDVAALTGAVATFGADGGALAGRRPAHELGRSAWAGTVTVGADGAAVVDLTGRADVQPGDSAEVQRTWAGDTFLLRRAAFQLVAGDDGSAVLAYGRPGAAVRLDVARGGQRWACPAVIGRAGWVRWSCRAGLAAGDRLTATHAGALVPPVQASATFPTLSYRPPAGPAPATVTGPPGRTVRFAEVGALGQLAAVDVALDAGGAGALSAGRPSRGSRHALAWRDGVALTLGGAAGFTPQIRFALGEPRVRGLWPAADVAVEVAAPDGAPIGRWEAVRGPGDTRPVPLLAGRDGAGPPTRHLAPGDHVEVTIGADEPIAWTLPDLDLALDPAGERLTGRLPLGTRGTLTVLEHGDGEAAVETVDDLADDRLAHRATLPLSAAPDGVFAVDLAALRDVDGFRLPRHRLVVYAVVAERADGHAVVAVVGRPWLDVELQSARLTGFGPSGQRAAVAVDDAAGRPVARVGATTAGADAAEFGPFGPPLDRPVWAVDLRDTFGAPTTLRPGDRVTITVGAARAVLDVPPLEGYVDLAARRVRGRGAPDAAAILALSSFDAGERRWTVTTGSDGTFDTPLPPDFPLRLGDWAALTARRGPHRLYASVVVPSLYVDLSRGRIVGRGVAGADVDLALLRDGRRIATASRRVDDTAAYDVDPHDEAGRRVPIAPGDVVVQRVGAQPVLTVTIPALAARHDATAGAIVGSAPAGSQVDLLGLASASDLGTAWHYGGTDVAPTGAFTAAVAHPRSATAGLARVALARVLDGAFASRWVVTPILNVPIGGERVCGLAMPWATVTARVDVAAGGSAQGAGRADGDGRFAIPLAFPDGRAVALAPGDTVRAVVDGEAVAATVPALTFAVDRAAGRGRGTAAPGAEVAIQHPAGSCAPVPPEDPLADVAYVYRAETTADARGAFDAALPALPPSPPGAPPPAFEAAVFDGTGHRHYRLVRALRVDARIDTPQVLGEAEAGQAVAVALTRPGGGGARATAVADAAGRFTATLAAEGGGAAPRLQAGDVVEAVAGGVSRRLTVPALTADWHPEAGLGGRTDPGAVVHVRLRLPRGRLAGALTDVQFTRTADVVGRFDVVVGSPRASWTAADVRRVEVWRALDGDDRALVRIDLAPDAPPPGGDVGRALLPWAGRGTERP